VAPKKRIVECDLAPSMTDTNDTCPLQILYPVSWSHVEKDKKENTAARISGGSREMGASALRRDLNAGIKAGIDSCIGFISLSIV
jgi:hypothetical protein